MPECVVCEEDVPRNEPRLPFRSAGATVALAHGGCDAGDRLPFLLRTGDVERAAHVCEDCEDDVEVRRVAVTGAHRERETRKQFRCPACEEWAQYGDL